MQNLTTQPHVSSLDDSLHSEPSLPKLSLVALRERKKDQTRDALSRAAFVLFQSKGYEGTTVAEIARAANVSRRTFFRYFSTKDALLFVDEGERLSMFRALLNNREPEEGAFAAIHRSCIALSRRLMQDRTQIIARASIIGASPALSKQERQQDLAWEHAITDALLAGIDDPSPLASRRARALGGAIWGGIRATMSEWHGDQGRSDLVALAEEGLELFAGAIDFEAEPRRPRFVDN